MSNPKTVMAQLCAETIFTYPDQDVISLAVSKMDRQWDSFYETFEELFGMTFQKAAQLNEF